MQKLIINSEEEKELQELLKTRESNPEFFSMITGIPLEEINIIAESKKSFIDTYFTDTSKLKLNEAELQLMEKEISNVGNRTRVTEEDENDNKLGEYFYPPIGNYGKPKSPFFQNIPIEYYDNEDGFWDSYIEERRAHFDTKNMKI